MCSITTWGNVQDLKSLLSLFIELYLQCLVFCVQVHFYSLRHIPCRRRKGEVASSIFHSNLSPSPHGPFLFAMDFVHLFLILITIARVYHHSVVILNPPGWKWHKEDCRPKLHSYFGSSSPFILLLLLWVCSEQVFWFHSITHVCKCLLNYPSRICFFPFLVLKIPCGQIQTFERVCLTDRHDCHHFGSENDFQESWSHISVSWSHVMGRQVMGETQQWILEWGTELVPLAGADYIYRSWILPTSHCT